MGDAFFTIACVAAEASLQQFRKVDDVSTLPVSSLPRRLFVASCHRELFTKSMPGAVGRLTGMWTGLEPIAPFDTARDDTAMIFFICPERLILQMAPRKGNPRRCLFPCGNGPTVDRNATVMSENRDSAP